MYIDNTHAQVLLKGLSLLRQDEELCDVELRVGDSRIFGHKVVLAAISDYFKAMFTGRMEESIVRTVYLHEIDEKSVPLLVDFAYSGYVSINNNNVESLLLSANMLRVSKVVTACCDFLLKQLHPSNCIGFYEFADRLGLHSFKRSCFNFATNHFVELICCEEFLTARPIIIKQLLSSNKINIPNDEIIFVALEKWVLHDKLKRFEHFSKLFNNIRLFSLRSSFLFHLITRQLVKEADGYLQLQIQAVLNSKNNPFRLLDEDFKAAHQIWKRNDNNLIVIGGKDSYVNPLSSVNRYSVKTGTWRICQNIPESKLCAAASYNNDQLYLIGGIGLTSDVNNNQLNGEHTSTGSCYSIKSNDWRCVRNMKQKRSSHVALWHGNLLYAIGGYDGKSSLKSGECYDPEHNCWTSISDMNYSRSSFAAVSLEDCIYVLGGQSTCTVERYDSSVGKWELAPAMSTKRINFGAAEVCGFIYVVGGHDGKEYLRSMERFDPISSEWTVVCPMPSARSGIGCAVIRNQIYVVGGHDGTRYLNTAYKYDVFDDMWMPINNMLSPRCYMAVSSAYFTQDDDEDEIM